MIPGATSVRLALLSTLVLTLGRSVHAADAGSSPQSACSIERSKRFIFADRKNPVLVEESAQIIRLAMAHDRAALVKLIDPHAQFRSSSGDVVQEFHSGADGAIQLVESLGPVAGFEAVVPLIGLDLKDLCTGPISVKLLVKSGSPADVQAAHMLVFSYDADGLNSLEAEYVTVTRGALEPAARRH